jgi:hypothetical protein
MKKSQLKSIIKEEIHKLLNETPSLKEEINLDDISNTPFSKLPPGLNLISKRGSSRNVYDYNDKYVLKIAKNNKGIHQNKKEIEILSKINSPLIPELKKYDEENYKYIVIEKVNDFKNYNQFMKFIFPNIENVIKKFIQFINQYKNEYDILSFISLDKPTMYYFILKYWLDKKDFSYVETTTSKKLKNDLSTYTRDDIINKSSPDKHITFMTYNELNKELNPTNSTNLLRQLIDDGFELRDWGWRNFGYKGDQLKLIDLGL